MRGAERGERGRVSLGKVPSECLCGDGKGGNEGERNRRGEKGGRRRGGGGWKKMETKKNEQNKKKKTKNEKGMENG